MSRKNEWSMSILKSRGWTFELAKELLPKPVWYYGSGARHPFWHKSDVLAAEETLLFSENRVIRAPKGQKDQKDQDQDQPKSGQKTRFVSIARKALIRSWTAAEKDISAPWLLAGQYHTAITRRISGLQGGDEVTSLQAEAWLREFLALEKRSAGKDLKSPMSHLVRCAWWMGRYVNDPLSREAAERYPFVLRAISEQLLESGFSAQSSESVMDLLRNPDFPTGMLYKDGLEKVWSVWYVPQAIRTSLNLLVALNPKDEYPEARAMHRRFILHIGGTNTGKTYAGFQRLIRAETGVYLAPLRLLALEAQETLLDYGVNCSLCTGEEEDFRPGDTHVASTAEKLNLKEKYEVAVIDECQMISDRERGYAWTRAILGVLAPEVHLCAAPEAQNILIRLIESCGDSWTLQVHERTTPLIPMSRTVDPERVMPGDALITFSKVGVLSVAEELRSRGKEPAIIYGALPYATRRRQMEGFLNGDMEYVVSTDAIGMGLNLPIRRIIFMETQKFDGVERRELLPAEIKQIAGRAGRFGMYNRGYVGATQNLSVIRAGLEAPVPPIEKAVVGFSDLVLSVDFDLLEVLTEWNRMPTVEPYVKLDITRYIGLISKMREIGLTFSKEEELRAANIPFDESNDELRGMFYDLLQKLQRGEPIEQPGLGAETEPNLGELELYYKKLDLYFSFTRTFGLPIDEERLTDTRDDVADEINEILLTNLRNNIRFCDRCGKPLGLYQKGRLCDACFRATRKPPSQPRKRRK